MEQRRKHKHEKNKSEYGRLRNLINRQVRKIKKNCLDNTVMKLKTNFIEEILKNRTTELERILENLK